MIFKEFSRKNGIFFIRGVIEFNHTVIISNLLIFSIYYLNLLVIDIKILYR